MLDRQSVHSDDKTFKYELVSSGGVKRKIGAGEEKHTIPAGFVHRARRGSKASFQLSQRCETEPES